MTKSSIKSGYLQCAQCNGSIIVSKKIYGGLPRFVCANLDCINSEDKSFGGES